MRIVGVRAIGAVTRALSIGPWQKDGRETPGELAGFAAHQHHITGQTIDIEGDSAHVESYVVYFLVPRDRSVDTVGPATLGKANTKEKTRMGSGRYIERA